MGPEQAAQLMTSGCNDMGGSLMNESITKAAGAFRLKGRSFTCPGTGYGDER